MCIIRSLQRLLSVTMYCTQRKRASVKVFLLEITVIGVTEVLYRAGLVSVIVVQPITINARVFCLEITVIGVRVQRTKFDVYIFCSSF
jgi:hypothetical protein